MRDLKRRVCLQTHIGGASLGWSRSYVSRIRPLALSRFLRATPRDYAPVPNIMALPTP